MAENNKINTTKEEIKEAVREVVMDSLADFNVNFLEKTEERLNNKIDETKLELKKDIQGARDWTDEKIGELRGELVLPLKRENEKIEKITDKLGDKKVFNTKDIEEIKLIEVFSAIAE